MRRVLLVASGLILALTAFSGCLPAPREGDAKLTITVSWPTASARSLDEIDAVNVTLKRQDLTVSQTLAISGSGASGTIEGLYAGDWSVKVDATSGDISIYTGQTTASVVSGETREVSMTLNAAPGQLDVTMQIQFLLDQGKEVTAGKIAIYMDPNTGTATYKDLARKDATLYALIPDLPSRTYDARIVIPNASSPIFTSSFFQFDIRPGRTTQVLLTNDGFLHIDIGIEEEPGQVRGLTAVKIGSQQVGLAWQVVNGATGYRVYRTDGTGRYKQLALVDGVDSVAYADTTFGTAPLFDGRVRYAVAALDGGQEGIRSAPVEVFPGG